MKDEKGFTLIELLAVIIILGAVMTIAIPSITYAINNSRKEVYIKNALKVISQAKITILEDNNYSQFLYDEDTTVYLHVNNVKLETGQISPFGELEDAYVVLAFNGGRKETPFDFYWVSKDIHGNRIDLTAEDELDVKDIYNNKGRKLNNKAPIGVRNKIVIIDKDGVVQKASQVIEVTREEASECYSYQLIDGTVKEAKITYYNRECGSDVSIPGIIDGYTVTTIYQYTFNNKGLTSVVIPGSVTKIESYAFSNNTLVSVTLPEGIKSIGTAAFASNKIPSVYFPDGLETISARAFKSNYISSFELPRSLKTLGSCAFCNNPIPNPIFLYATKSDGSDDYTTIRGYIGDLSEFPDKVFRIPAEKNGIKVTKIANSAFYTLKMVDFQVVIPETVTEIGNNAFDSCSIASVNLPNGLTKIGSSAFSTNRIASISIPNTVTTIGSSAFYSNRLTEIVIPDSVTSVGALAFQNNWVPDTAPSTMRWIYKRTTSGIDYSVIIGYAGKNKDNIVIPATQNGVALTELADSSLRYLSLTGGITIPSSVKKVGQLSFIRNKLTYIDNGDGDKTAPIAYKRKADGSIDKTIIISYGAMPSNTVVIPSGVKELDDYAFYYTSITGIKIPEGVTKIGKQAFQLCKLNGTVVLPSTVTSIGNQAFYKYNSSSNSNGALTKIVNKTERAFNWTDITGAPSAANFVTGTVENWYGNIEVVDRE